MAALAVIIVALVKLTFTACIVLTNEYSCAPFFFQKVYHAGRAHKSIVRFECAKEPTSYITCDPTFTERVYYRTESGYSCMMESLARPAPLPDEPANSNRDGYDDYFKRLGMTATPAGWMLQDATASVLLQMRPNVPLSLILEPCWNYFENLGYKYTGGRGGPAWEGANATHRVRYSPIAQDYRNSACVLSADFRRYRTKIPTRLLTSVQMVRDSIPRFLPSRQWFYLYQFTTLPRMSNGKLSMHGTEPIRFTSVMTS
ncbi:hypothetical protein EVAR_41865_1 [Eumeta japonica]|uniref:Uncharacterized protein n=1 Tax=Eumeta variegata TaxID=151549 RepID=A0A4C1XCK5_EUMVA|nr:hypothetical protein EVAR_41865_1 [Eumeta japonica]